jgi:hypothetical protein
VFPFPVPVRRASIRAETASTVAILGGAFVLLEAFLLYFGTPALLPGLLVGAAIVALGALASSLRRHREPTGAVIVLLGIVSLFSGGGFYVGAVLAIVGGALIASIRSYEIQDHRFSSSASGILGPPCPNCGHHLPTWTSKCPYCGFP